MPGLNSPFISPFSRYSQYKNQSNYYNNLHNYNSIESNQYNSNNNYIEHEKPCPNPKQNDNSTEDEKNKTREFFEILGIKLYFDDILLLCLIFFLYNEDVHDDMLFMALILLLLS